MDSAATYSAVLSNRARKEIGESWNWYEERQMGLGDRFVKEVTNRVEIIQKAPRRFPTRIKSYKETVLPTFPFVIIYRINEQKKLIRITSVFHQSRNPKKKY